MGQIVMEEIPKKSRFITVAIAKTVGLSQPKLPTLSRFITMTTA